MGADPAASVADGRGELHDTKGVWIGDGSAFPTAPGVNPMISIMSLAHRTAENMLDRGVRPPAAQLRAAALDEHEREAVVALAADRLDASSR